MRPPLLDLRTAPPLTGVGDGPARVAREWNALDLATVLADWDPVVVSSSAAGLGLERSDLDVVCDLRAPGFATAVRAAFGDRPGFGTSRHGALHLTAFRGLDMDIEIVGEPRPVEEQLAYRHAVAHRRVVDEHGPAFAAAVRDLRRRTGLKTEPAIAHLLHLDGDPYVAVERLA
jgi:hypothetical protein